MGRRLSALLLVAVVGCGDADKSTCQVAADCGTDACTAYFCDAGRCVSQPIAAGFVLESQTAGDCVELRCDGDGNVDMVAVDDPAANDNPCTITSCTDGSGTSSFVPAATACGTGLQCDGAGACVQCLAASECPGVDDDCNTRTCTDGVCGIAFSAQGTALATQTAGDCKRLVCDGAGASGPVADGSDLPADEPNQCTAEVCVGDTPAHNNLAARTACGTNQLCDGAGACVDCLLSTDCPPSGSECLVPTCNANTCENDPLPAGTPQATQLAGDCKVIQCDGAGGSSSVVDSNDVPADEPNPCTTEACNGETPVHDNLPTGTPCGGGKTCDGNGTCI